MSLPVPGPLDWNARLNYLTQPLLVYTIQVRIFGHQIIYTKTISFSVFKLNTLSLEIVG